MSRPRVDTGKFGKEMKALKPRDARKLDKEQRLPPHKKPRTYVLKVEWTTTSQHLEEHRYPSKAAREIAAKVIRRRLEEEKRSHRYRDWRGWDCTYTKEVGPIVTEFIEEGSTGPGDLNA